MKSQAQLTQVANVRMITDEAFEVFKYVKVGGRRGTLFVEREVADDAKQVRLRLRKHNAALSPNFADSMREVEEAIRASRQVCSVMRPARGGCPRQGPRYDLRDDRLVKSPAEDFTAA